MHQWALLRALRDVPARDLNLAAGTALTVLNQSGAYILVGIAGIVVARALGPHDRGLYSLVTTTAIVYGMLAMLGISRAGIYFVGQGKCSLQQMVSNSLVWFLFVGGLWLTGAAVFLLVWPGLLASDTRLVNFLTIGLGGVFLVAIGMSQDVLMAGGSVLKFNIIEFAGPFLRSILAIAFIVLLATGLAGVLLGWLVAGGITTLLALLLVSKYAELRPRLDWALLGLQMCFGLKRQLSFILQAGSHRLDVFLVAAFVSNSALGQYAVAFGVAELLWQLPLALGVVLFPKVAALDTKANAETAAATCRRTLCLTFLGMLALLALGHMAIGLLYGEEFLGGIWAFYILAPSAIFYTVHRALGTSLAAGGMPEAGIYSSAVGLLATISLGIILIPRMGIEGAALASLTAYALDAAVNVGLFMRVHRYPLREILLINRSDIAVSLRLARTWFARTQPIGADL